MRTGFCSWSTTYPGILRLSFRNVSDFMTFEGVGRNFVRWLVYCWEAAAESNAHAWLSVCMLSSFPLFHFLILASRALTPNNHLNPQAKSSFAIRETQDRTTLNYSIAEALSRRLIWPVPLLESVCNTQHDFPHRFHALPYHWLVTAESICLFVCFWS